MMQTVTREEIICALENAPTTLCHATLPRGSKRLLYSFGKGFSVAIFNGTVTEYFGFNSMDEAIDFYNEIKEIKDVL